MSNVRVIKVLLFVKNNGTKSLFYIVILWNHEINRFYIILHKLYFLYPFSQKEWKFLFAIGSIIRYMNHQLYKFLHRTMDIIGIIFEIITRLTSLLTTLLLSKIIAGLIIKIYRARANRKCGNNYGSVSRKSRWNRVISERHYANNWRRQYRHSLVIKY